MISAGLAVISTMICMCAHSKPTQVISIEPPIISIEPPKISIERQNSIEKIGFAKVVVF